MPCQLRRRDRNIGKLFCCGLRNHPAVGHEKYPVLAEPGIFHLHHKATGSSGGLWRYLDDLKQRPQYAAAMLISAGD
jgi:hypothetical protein